MRPAGCVSSGSTFVIRPIMVLVALSDHKESADGEALCAPTPSAQCNLGIPLKSDLVTTL